MRLRKPLEDRSIDILRAFMRDGHPLEQLRAIEAAEQMEAAAEPLIPDLMALLTSSDYVECTSLYVQSFGHAMIAEEAASALILMRVPLELDPIRALLRDHRIFEMPEASYDQGAYIGDYGTEYLSPAVVAARLTEGMGPTCFELMPDLAVNAMHENEHIGKPTRRYIYLMAKNNLARASPAQRAYFCVGIEAIAADPQAIEPTTTRGFDLRDLVAFGRKRLSASD